MSKKKKTKQSIKSGLPIPLFRNEKHKGRYDDVVDNEYDDEIDDEFNEMLASLERGIDDYQTRSFSKIFDNIISNRMQLGSIQLTLVVISVLLSLQFFGWITALVIGLVLGFVALITFLAAIVANLDMPYLDSRRGVNYYPDEDEEE